jgi:hypothetical protein
MSAETTTHELLCIGCTLQGAVQRLNATLGGKFFSIRMALVFLSQGRVEAEWQVYDGITSSIHSAKTLAGAVNDSLIAIADHQRDGQPSH